MWEKRRSGAANSVVFSVDFSEDVSNVDATDFTLALSGVTANATVTVGNAGDSDASTYTVTVDTIAGDGTLGLDIAATCCPWETRRDG